ncbi:MAG: hypothetical protein LBU83_11105 [Bacteroidales bacterium]|nr:hypothetical protein [Bacteroidales bacterium]
MNRLNLKIVVAIAICLVGMTMFSGCEKNLSNPPIPSTVEEGVYVGTYTKTNLYRGFSWTATPTIELKKGKYSYKELSNGKYYTSGSGNYSINESKIIFELISYPIPMEDIGVIEELLLKGEYDYTLDGEKLKFSKTVFPLNEVEEYLCEFELIKQ